jgi:hypothetical protein
VGAKANIWRARDLFFEEPVVSDLVKNGMVEKAPAEKAEAGSPWRRIKALTRPDEYRLNTLAQPPRRTRA